MDGEDFGGIDEETEHHLVKLFRRISQVYRKKFNTRKFVEIYLIKNHYLPSICQMGYVDQAPSSPNDFLNQ